LKLEGRIKKSASQKKFDFLIAKGQWKYAHINTGAHSSIVG
jgi:hypothetical protein